MRAATKYRYRMYKGKKISDREILRRVAQSMGYRFTVDDMPQHWFDFMKKGGFDLQPQEAQTHQHGQTEFVDENITGKPVETKTLQL